MKFTTSWDDGSVLDKALVELLERYGCTGTFYVCPKQLFTPRVLTEEEIRDIAARHEIGAHTINHPRLTKIAPDEILRELQESKAWVERVTGKSCSMFCYPFGSVNESARNAAETAGFAGARTVQKFCFDYEDPFLLPTSVHVYGFPWRKVRKTWLHWLDPLGPLRTWRKEYRHLHVPLLAQRSWQALARHMFTRALKQNAPFFHLWGHSEEVDRLGMWGELESFLAFVGQHKNVEHVVNSALLTKRT